MSLKAVRKSTVLCWACGAAFSCAVSSLICFCSLNRPCLYCVVWIFYSTVSGCHCCSDTVHVWKTISLCVSPKIEGRPVSLYNALIGDCMRACLWLTWARKYKVQNKRGMYAWWRRARDEKIRNTEQNINRETRCTRCQSEAADEGACNIERRRYKNKKNNNNWRSKESNNKN